MKRGGHCSFSLPRASLEGLRKLLNHVLHFETNEFHPSPCNFIWRDGSPECHISSLIVFKMFIDKINFEKCILLICVTYVICQSLAFAW